MHLFTARTHARTHTHRVSLSLSLSLSLSHARTHTHRVSLSLSSLSLSPSLSPPLSLSQDNGTEKRFLKRERFQWRLERTDSGSMTDRPFSFLFKVFSHKWYWTALLIAKITTYVHELHQNNNRLGEKRRKKTAVLYIQFTVL